MRRKCCLIMKSCSRLYQTNTSAILVAFTLPRRQHALCLIFEESLLNADSLNSYWVIKDHFWSCSY